MQTPGAQPSQGTNNDALEHDVRAIQAAVEDVTQNYLETLDALSTVYDAAAGFAQLFDRSSIAHFTLQRILEALELDCGAIFLEDGGMLRFQFDAVGGLTLLRQEAIEDASIDGQARFLNGSEAEPYLRPEAAGRNVLLAPVVAAQRRLGMVVVVSQGERLLTTKDLKLVAAVTSQAAIALGGAQHLEQVLVERQKLSSIIENSAGGIVVLTPNGRTTLTNGVARKLLGLPEGRAEGYRLIDELSDWKFSHEPESLYGEGPPEVSLEMTRGEGEGQRTIWAVGRRVRASGGELVNIVLNLHDPSWTRSEG